MPLFSLRRKSKSNLKDPPSPPPANPPALQPGYQQSNSSVTNFSRPPPSPTNSRPPRSPATPNRCSPPDPRQALTPSPQFTFVRTTTAGSEPLTEWPLKNNAPVQPDRHSFVRSTSSTPASSVLSLPATNLPNQQLAAAAALSQTKHHSFLASEPEKLDRRSIRKSRHTISTPRNDSDPSIAPLKRSLSQKLHLAPRPSRPRALSSLSANLPETLSDVLPDASLNDLERESKWEKRATLLVQTSPSILSDEGSSLFAPHATPERPTRGRQTLHAPDAPHGRTQSTSSAPGDLDIQTAIELHENEQYEKSTAIFRHLADPNGQNNALAQVLYGLALRHGWGVETNTEAAIQYLGAAAKNSAKVEELALKAGMKKGGAAKGELVLAIYELANCFRNGWGVQKDIVAAMQYYLTAANLGDTDSMNEVAYCYLKGQGTKKDKKKAAEYYRLAEKKGHKTLGNSWIWKEKYDPKT